jgi:hypothetical protein
MAEQINTSVKYLWGRSVHFGFLHGFLEDAFAMGEFGRRLKWEGRL